MSRLLPKLAISLIAAFAIGGCKESAPVPGPVQARHHGSEATAVFAGGCFWCVEADFQKLTGVITVVSGYSGGTTENPTYKNYASGGHREVVEVTYDPTQVSYGGLVEWLLKHADPTDPNGSFVDRGVEYSSAIYYETPEEKAEAEKVIKAVDALKVFKKKIALDVTRRAKFWPAEAYHQDYAANSLVKYDFYRKRSGRDAFVKESWGDKAKKLTIATSVPKPKAAAVGSKPWKSFKKPSKSELRKKLTKIQYGVTQEEDTERPFKNPYWNNKQDGIYVDVVSGEPLFSSSDKFKSGTGWPSFSQPLDSNYIVLKQDNRLLASRTEVRSKLGDSHVGHVFDDGPADLGGKRYCVNSASLRFVPKSKMEAEGYGDFVSDVK